MRRLSLTAGSLVLLAGCASFSADGGFESVGQLAQERAGVTPVWQRTDDQAETAQARTTELLGQPLTPARAVEVAILNNRGLQASFQELGIAESDLVRAGRLSNPSFSFARLSGGGHVEIERAVGFNILGLFTMPLAKRVEEQRFARVRLQAAADTVRLSADTRRAYFEAVAAQELVSYFQQVKEAAEASRELASRMAAAGNFSKLAHLREQAFYADATANLARAQHLAVSSREQLTRRLGLSGEQVGFVLPKRLPDLPEQPLEPKDAEQTAMDTRLDVMMARQATQSVASSLGLTRATRMVNVLHLGYANVSETGEERKDGYEIEVELPLFDFGSTRVARAEATYMQAMHRTAQTAIDARSEVRESYSAYRTAYDLAKHYRDEVVPLRKRISEENLLRYNGMLIGVFELLADSRDQVSSVTASVEALRDYWVAETNLQTAMTTGSPGSAASAQSPTAAASGGQAAH
jgi:outer membrane protein TolC